jgi:hypothetical protein
MQLQRLELGLKVDTTSSHTEVNHVSAPEILEPVLKSGSGGLNSGLSKYKSADQTIIENGAVRLRGTAARTGLLGAKPSSVGGKKTGEEHSHIGGNGLKSSGSSSGSSCGSGGVGGEKKSVSSGKEQGRKKSWGHKRQDGDQNEDIWGTARGERSESWGHDDRFVRDDGFYGKQVQRREGAFIPRNKGEISENWRDRKESERNNQKTTLKNETSKTEPEPIAPPPLPEEENWD